MDTTKEMSQGLRNQKLYRAIEQHLNPFQIYSQKLLGEKVIGIEEINSIQRLFKSKLEAKFQDAKNIGKLEVKSILEKIGLNLLKLKL